MYVFLARMLAVRAGHISNQTSSLDGQNAMFVLCCAGQEATIYPRALVHICLGAQLAVALYRQSTFDGDALPSKTAVFRVENPSQLMVQHSVTPQSIFPKL